MAGGGGRARRRGPGLDNTTLTVLFSNRLSGAHCQTRRLVRCRPRPMVAPGPGNISWSHRAVVAAIVVLTVVVQRSWFRKRHSPKNVKSWGPFGCGGPQRLAGEQVP